MNVGELVTARDEFGGKSLRTGHARLRASLASGIAFAAVASTTPAFAAPDACGPAVNGEVTCTPDGNPYPTGIQYSGTGSLTLNLANGVVVDAPSTLFGVSNFRNGTDTVSTINAATGSSINARIGIISSSAVAGSNGTAVVNSGANIQAGFLGIQAQAAGNATVNNSGNILVPVGPLTNVRGIVAISQTGNMAVTNSGTIDIRNGGPAIGIVTSSNGSGTHQITNSGTITIRRDGFDRTALGIRSFGGGAGSSVNIANSGAVTIDGASFGLGLTAFANGDVTIASSGPVTVTAGRATGIFAGTSSDTGNIVVNSTGTIQANSVEDGLGDEAGGIFTRAIDGSTTITSENVQTTGNGTPGIRASSNSGSISITSGNVSTAGTNSDGIAATSDTGAINIASTGALTTSGDGSTGIAAITGGSILTSFNGAIGSNGLFAPATIRTSGADSAGIILLGGGDVTVTGSGNIDTRGADSPGLFASSSGGNVSIQTGSVSTATDSSTGITGVADTGNVTIDALTATTAGNNAFAVGAFSNAGNLTIATRDVRTSGAGSFGILALTSEAGNVAITSRDLRTTGNNATGIFAAAETGNISITNTGALSTVGTGADAIFADTDGAITIANNGTIATAGADSDGIFATAGRALTITGRGSITTAGSNAFGIFADSTGGNVSVTTGAVRTTGRGSTGVSASSATGTTTVDATSVATTGNNAAGIIARSATGTTVNAPTVTTTGSGADGIIASAMRGPVVVTSDRAAVTGAGSVAIRATSANGPVTVNSRTATATSGSAIVANSGTGPVTVAITGAVRSDTQPAVDIQAGTTATVSVAAGGSVTGPTGIFVSAPVSTTITNAGVITNGSGFAVNARGGPATVTNTGTINGRLGLTDSADTFTNSGTFNASGGSQFGAGNDVLNNSGLIVLSGDPTSVFANADLDFGAGTDTFNNSGTVRVALERPLTTSTLLNLERFNNSGLVDLRNGRTGDVLSIPGTFTGTGNSTLGLDVNLGTNSADRLVVGNAQGSTTLALAITGTAGLGAGPVLVQAGAGTSANAFVLPDTQAGLVELRLGFADNAFRLVGTPSDAAFRTTTFAGALRDLWHESAEAWSAQMREGRDTAFGGNAGEPGARFWMQGYGRLSEREGISQQSAFGQTRDVDLTRDQDFFGGQIGVDFGGSVGEQGGFAFGVTGGYVDSRVNFASAGDNLSMQAANIGAYGRFSTGMFFVNGLAKYDHILDVSTRSIIGDFEADMDGELFGGRLEAGFRFGGGGFYVEPVGTISYVDSDLDGFGVRGTTVEFDNEHGLRGSLGARVGSAMPISYGATANIYAGAHYIHEFGDPDEVVLATGENSVRLVSQEEEDRVRALVGINVAGSGPVSGFIEGNGEFLNDYEGFGMRGGIRLRF